MLLGFQLVLPLALLSFSSIFFLFLKIKNKQTKNLSQSCLLFFIFITFMYIHVHAFTCHGLHAKVRGQLVGFGSLLLAYRFQESNSGLIKLDRKHLFPLSHLARQPFSSLIQIFVYFFMFPASKLF